MTGTDDRVLTAERIDELLAFRPLLETPGRSFVEGWGGGQPTPDGEAIQIPYPIYPADVLAFFRLAGQPWWCDYGYNPRQAHDWLHDDAFIAAASLDQVRTVLTYSVRGERFSDGHWAHLLETGRIAALLRRLAVLREALDV